MVTTDQLVTQSVAQGDDVKVRAEEMKAAVRQLLPDGSPLTYEELAAGFTKIVDMCLRRIKKQYNIQ